VKRSSVWLVLAAAVCWIPSSVLGAQAKKQNSQERLKFVLILTRHGVRSPTWSNARLDEYAKEPWPKWGVEPGELTVHGRMLMTQFGAYYRALFAEHSLVSAAGCEDVSNVYLDADSDGRTLDTARGIADGMFPGCTAEIHSLKKGTQDVLFHSSRKLGKPDAQLGLLAVSGRMGEDAAALLPAYQAPLEAMHSVLSGCASVDCPLGNKKSLLATPASLGPGTGDHLAELKGPLSMAATFAENLQLEYLEGMPDEQVGWGRVNEDKVRALMALHATNSELLQRTPYIARVQASNLLYHMELTLQQAEEGRNISGALGSAQQKAVFLVGHDTNISNVATLLDAHWLVEGYQRDDAAPGGALVFELWQRPGRDDAIRVYYLVQSPLQMRNSIPLSLAEPPKRARIFLPGCGLSEEGAPCDWKDFRRLVSSVVDDKFVQ
jgi:4-phytase/acid phosphatase